MLSPSRYRRTHQSLALSVDQGHARAGSFPRCEWVNVSSNNRYFRCGDTIVWNGTRDAQPPIGLIAAAVREYQTTGRIANPPAPCRWVTLADGTKEYRCGARPILGVGGPLQAGHAQLAASNPPAPQCRWITLTDGIRQFWCGARLIYSSHSSNTSGELAMLSPSRHRRTSNTKSRIRRELLRVRDRFSNPTFASDREQNHPHPGGSPFPRCRWNNGLGLGPGAPRHFICGNTIIWSGPKDASPPLGLIARAKREYETTGRISNPVVHAGLAGAMTPAIALRPGALAPLSVNFPAAAAAAGVGAAQPGPAMAVPGMQMQPFWPQFYTPYGYGRRAPSTQTVITIETSPGGQSRASVNDQYTGELLHTTRWYLLAPQAQAAASAWISANL